MTNCQRWKGACRMERWPKYFSSKVEESWAIHGKFIRPNIPVERSNLPIYISMLLFFPLYVWGFYLAVFSRELHERKSWRVFIWCVSKTLREYFSIPKRKNFLLECTTACILLKDFFTLWKQPECSRCNAKLQMNVCRCVYLVDIYIDIGKVSKSKFSNFFMWLYGTCVNIHIYASKRIGKSRKARKIRHEIK